MVLAGIRRLTNQAIDRIEYAAFATRLTIVDWLYGPEPLTGADRERERKQERLAKDSSAIADAHGDLQLSHVAPMDRTASPATGENL
jgi:hypothetical protein